MTSSIDEDRKIYFNKSFDTILNDISLMGRFTIGEGLTDKQKLVKLIRFNYNKTPGMVGSVYCYMEYHPNEPDIPSTMSEEFDAFFYQPFLLAHRIDGHKSMEWFSFYDQKMDTLLIALEDKLGVSIRV
jgi:hypothetical protein